MFRVFSTEMPEQLENTVNNISILLHSTVLLKVYSQEISPTQIILSESR